MKTKNLYFILSILLFLLSGSIVKAQKVLTIELQANPGYSWIGIPASSFLSSETSKGNFNVDFGVLAHYNLNKQAGILSGIQLKTYRSNFSGKDYNVSFKAIDTENKSYIRNVTGTDIKESTTLRFINIPIRFFYDLPLSRFVSFFGTIGPGITIPIQSKVVGSGTFTYTGLYPELNNAVLKDLPPYGFNSNVPVSVEKKLKSIFFIINATASAGFVFKMSRYWKFHTAVNYSRSFTGIASKDKSNNFHISDELGSFYSLANSKNSFLSDFYISIGIQKVILF